MSFINSHREKSISIIKTLKVDIPKFRRSDVVVDPTELGCGVYGSVYTGYINSLRQKVAIKIFDEKTPQREQTAEAMACRKMSGHPNFPFLFGRVEPNKLLFEFIGDDVSAPSLKDVFLRKIPLPHWKEISMDLVRALHSLHEHGLLHNDLHSGNILIRHLKHVKFIDFGKATLIDDPVMYCIKPDTEKQRRYNTLHKHLGYELRNVPGSFASCKSDIFSLGYNLDKIAGHVSSSLQFRSVVSNMILPEPSKRLDLPTVLYKISKII